MPLPTTKNTYLSGYSLEYLGWEKKGFTWTKGENVITYDGCIWLFNGKKVEFIFQIL